MKSWKGGNVKLVHKRNDRSKLTNYRPITLTSNWHKLFARIMNARLRYVCERSGIFPEEQNGFREDRSTMDNVFTLLTLIEKAEKQKQPLHLSFIDLAKAYDTVDRMILWKKMKQLGFSESFINILKSMYNDDTLECQMGRISTGRVYLRRGLRQGCNLSPLLFSIYVQELSERLNDEGVGVRLWDQLVSHLFFADDLVLIGANPEDLSRLLTCLETWCQDFKMKVSIEKSKVISPLPNGEWPVVNLEMEYKYSLEQVEEYKYLGIEVYPSPRLTFQSHGQN